MPCFSTSIKRKELIGLTVCVKKKNETKITNKKKQKTSKQSVLIENLSAQLEKKNSFFMRRKTR